MLVKGQPNVSYICSRYYRAPELMFGATEYTTAVDMWSVGTILVELLLGHLPFQGQDSTQQHLVEIMKLLGTPTEKELRMMRANCSAEDLPKLKAYPWDKVFPQGTPPRAMDLAYKLLAYDPSLRLTATQALQHPFLQGVEYILDSNGVTPREAEASRAWQQQLQTHFSQYAAARNGATLGLLPQLEGSLKSVLLTPSAAEGGVDRVMPAVLAEVKAVLERCERAEHDAFAELQRKVMSASNGSADVGAHDRAGAAQAAAEAQAAANESAATIERMQRQAAEAREEAAAMREQVREHACRPTRPTRPPRSPPHPPPYPPRLRPACSPARARRRSPAYLPPPLEGKASGHPGREQGRSTSPVKMPGAGILAGRSGY